jgi:hypothetical protein
MKLILFLLLASAVTLPGANLVLNPDFEAQTLADPGSAPFIQSWGKFGGPVSLLRNGSSVYIVDPLHVNIAGFQPGGGIVQSLETYLLPETTYRVSLDYSVNSLNPSMAAGQTLQFGIGVGSGSGESSVLTNEYLPAALFELGGEGDSALVITTTTPGVQSVAFEFRTGWYPDGLFDNPAFYVVSDDANTMAIFIDNISITIVPEPSGLGFLVLGAVGFFLVRRRSRSREKE